MAPVLVGLMFAHAPLISLPFFTAGVLKIVYDVLLYRGFLSEVQLFSDFRSRLTL
jgi:hypothetical protein